MRNTKLHKNSYKIFRHYLNVVYQENKEKNIIPLSLGYPLSGVFPLSRTTLEKLSPLDSKEKEKIRPGYGWEAGSSSLRETIVEYENERHSTSYLMENICMTAGGSYALNRVLEYLFIHLKTNKNELLISSPTFYRMLGRAEEYAKISNMRTSRKNAFQPTLEDIKTNITSKTQAIFICNPSNPGYNYINNKEFEKIISFLDKKKIYLVIDEVGDNFFHKEFARYPKTIQNPYVIRLCSASKAYQLAEYRLGYVIGGKSVVGDKSQGIVKLIGDDIGNPTLAANEAWEYILKEEINWMKEGRSYKKNEYQFRTRENELSLKRKCETVSKYLNNSKYISDVLLPDASFNLTFQFQSKKIKTDVEFFEQLLSREKVSLVPCSSFGLKKTDRYMRLTFAVPDDTLKKGLIKLTQFLNQIN